MKFIVKLGIFITLLIIGVLVIGAYWTFYKPLPNHSSNYTLEEINDPVDIHWDPYGTPYIYAQNDTDLYTAVGFIHAQERLWQMTLSQISAEGRFAEFFGEEMIAFDIHQRTLGFWETAKQIENDAPDQLIDILTAYSKGVNRYIRQNKSNLPIEFSLLDVEPIEWTPTHSIALIRLMAWDQNTHWFSEMTYAYLGRYLDSIQLQQITPQYINRYELPTSLQRPHSNIVDSTYSFFETELQLRSSMQKKGVPFGSNAWAVNGSKTQSGKPILAGDPHMGLSIPGIWYEMYMRTPNMDIAGATIPGSPFVILGQNKNIAWTITNMMADDTDFFLEKTVPDQPDYYISDSLSTPISISPFTQRNEIIKVKNANDYLHKVLSTERGPLITNIHPSENLTPDQPVSLAWKGHDISHELWALYRMNQATNIDEFRSAVEQFNSPGINFIYADSDNNIALFSGADLPVRNHNPIAFRNGWDPDHQWFDTIPFDELPHIVNPPENYVAHANNKMHADSYPHYIATFWESPSRILRIQQILEFSDSLSTEEMQALQYDTYSEHAREITEIILPVLRSNDSSEEIREALPYLENWDYRYEPTSTAASIFDLFFMKLSKNLLADEIGTDAYNALIELEYLPVQIVSRFIKEGNHFNITDTPGDVLSLEFAIRESMTETINQLRQDLGFEPYEWRWENLHSLTLKPPFLSDAADDPESSNILQLIVNNLLNRGPFPGRGHGMSVNKGQYSWHEPFQMNLGASIRRIVDFSTPERSFSVLPTGQSGNPLSANYGDQSNLWVDGRYRYIYQDSTFFQQTSYRTMSLFPSE